MRKKVVIVGAGGHGAVIADILELNDYEIIGFIYDDPNMKGGLVSGYNVLGSIDDLDSITEAECAFVAQVDHEKRTKYNKILESRGLELINAIHPTALIMDAAVHADNIILYPRTFIGYRNDLSNTTVPPYMKAMITW